MTDAESILAALEPEEDDMFGFYDPRRTVSLDTATVQDLGFGGLGLEWCSSPEVKPMSFDDVWGDALEQANITEESLADINPMEPHDELLNLLSKLRD